MNTTEMGRRAEVLVARHLQSMNYKVIDTNWKTKTCEVDLIAFKNDTVFFVEVKYRGTPFQGSGLEYITSAKLKRMHYAAELWTAMHYWVGEYVLSGASVNGQGQIEFIEQL